MSSNPHGMRFSPFASGAQTAQQQLPVMKVPPKPKQYVVNTSRNNLSGSDTDVSTSNENLSKEERYVVKHTARVEPQGQEMLLYGKNMQAADSNQARALLEQQMRFSSNTSSDSMRYATPTSQRSVSEVKANNVAATGNPNQTIVTGGNQSNVSDSNRSSLIGATSNSNRNSLKECNSNRSSMDVSQSSYNTLIIHNDDSLYYDYSTPPPSYNMSKKERPRSFGEREQQQLTDGLSEIPEEYLKQSQVLKHLAKEVALAKNLADPNMMMYDQSEEAAGGKLKSKSQPDLSNLTEAECEDIDALFKENQQLKEQLNTCLLKLGKTQKLQLEINNIQRAYESLVQSNERRERLERNARNKLQAELRHSQEMNRVLREQLEAMQLQIAAMPDHQMDHTQKDSIIAQLTAQNKDLAEQHRRQFIEIQAQSATLEEQRVHITILDSALKRMEEENRQKQIYVERCKQLQHALQSLQNSNERRESSEHNMFGGDAFGADMNANNSSSSDGNLKWQLREKDSQIMRLENECAKLEQRNMEDAHVRNVSKTASEQRLEAERMMAEAKQEKLRYLDEQHSTSRRLAEMQGKMKMMESRLAEKDAMIRKLQGKNLYGSNNNSYGSYNLSSDSFALNPLGYNSQASFDVSDISNPTTSLLEPTYYGQSNPTYNQSAINLQSMNNYSPVSSSYGGSNASTNYVPSSSNFGQGGGGFAFDAQRRIIDNQLKELDEALMSKVSEMSMLNSSIRTNKMQLQQIHSTSLGRNLAKGQSSIDITVGGKNCGNSGSSGSSTSSSALSSATTISAAAMSSLSAAQKKGLSTSCKNINYEQETFY